ncbi:MAG: hypothetical protein LBO09_06580 [Candidatus Peribacteria bacterium]|nr:hypothetical protein [Candidatus Peribacteria bacterium]
MQNFAEVNHNEIALQLARHGEAGLIAEKLHYFKGKLDNEVALAISNCTYYF